MFRGEQRAVRLHADSWSNRFTVRWRFCNWGIRRSRILFKIIEITVTIIARTEERRPVHEVKSSGINKSDVTKWSLSHRE